MDIGHLQQHVFAYIALFIGVGMLVLWEVKFSLIMLLITFISNIVFYIIYSPLTVDEFLINGGMLTVTVAIFSVFLIRMRYRLTYKEIKSRLELANSKEIIEQKHVEVLHQKQEITDSINYAKNIQHAILPDKKDMLKVFPDSFLLFKAKDIVSGDFFWFTQKEDQFLFAAADCTGHGVPGALMSMIGNSFLNEITNEKNILSPGEMLSSLRKLIVQTFKKSSGKNERKDGMDIALCSFNTKTLQLQYAGAYNPLWLFKKGEFTEITGNKFPVGSHINEVMENFTNHEVQLEKGDCIYVFTDGFADQFGGPKGKKFKYNMFKDLLVAAKGKAMEEQKSILYNAFENWKGSLEQVDDLLIIGIRIS